MALPHFCGKHCPAHRQSSAKPAAGGQTERPVYDTNTRVRTTSGEEGLVVARDQTAGGWAYTVKLPGCRTADYTAQELTGA